jgi:hypothetical protein
VSTRRSGVSLPWNLAHSSIVCGTTIEGDTIRVLFRLPICSFAWRANSNMMRVLPSPQSAKAANFRFFIAISEMSRW